MSETRGYVIKIALVSDGRYQIKVTDQHGELKRHLWGFETRAYAMSAVRRLLAGMTDGELSESTPPDTNQ